MAELAPQTGILFLSEQSGLTRQATHKRIDRVAPKTGAESAPHRHSGPLRPQPGTRAPPKPPNTATAHQAEPEAPADRGPRPGPRRPPGAATAELEGLGDRRRRSAPGVGFGGGV